MSDPVPRYLCKAAAHAGDLGLPDDFRVWALRNQLPEWVRRLQAPGGFEALERELGVTIPAAVREFWSDPVLMCAWTVAQLDALSEPPAVEAWTDDGARYLTIDVHHHSGCVAGVRLTGADDPPVVLGDDPQTVWAATFSAYLEDGFRRFELYRQHGGE